MISKINNKLSNIKYFEERKRFLLFSLFLLICLYFVFKLFGDAFATYETSVKLTANIDRAIYLVENEGMSFNIDPDQIIPSNEPYVYKFSISNFNASGNSDIDIEYFLRVRTTTNLPLTFELYRNENHDAAGAVNLFSSPRVVQDEDGAWYNIYEPEGVYEMLYSEPITDVYTLVINFPKVYASNSIYADLIENIEVVIKSKQIIR